MGNFVGTSGNDTFNGGEDEDVASGAGGNDTLSGAGGKDVLSGDAGGDTLNGGDGDDELYSGSISDFWVRPWFNNTDWIAPTLDTGSEVDTLNGGAGIDRIYAGYGDFVDGGADLADLLISLRGANAGVTADFSNLDNGGTLTIAGHSITNVRAVLWIEGSDFDDFITGSDRGNDFGWTYAPIFGLGSDDHLIAGSNTGNIYGGDGNDTIEVHQKYDGGPGFNGYMYGEAGDDAIVVTGDNLPYPLSGAFGGEGDDYLNLAGAISGGAGNDEIVVAESAYTTSAQGDEGADTITDTDRGNSLYGGTGADVIVGNGGQDLITSAGVFDPETGWDFIDRGTEHDVLSAGDHDDSIAAGYGDDVDGGAGFDNLALSLIGSSSGIILNASNLTSGSYVIGGGTIQNVESVYQLWGTNFGDTLTFSSNITVFGMNGDDTINGSAFNDEIHGGEGKDSISAGEGDDRIYLDELSDAATGETINGGAGFDTLIAEPRFDFPDDSYFDITGVTLTGIEKLFGSIALTQAQLSSVSVLSGMFDLKTSGAVSVAGLIADGYVGFRLNPAGNQLDLSGFTPDGFLVVSGSESADTVISSAFGANIYANGGDDKLYGGQSSDTLNGGDGNDILDGELGSDWLWGGAGDDLMIVDSTFETVGEAENEGTDTVESSVSFSLTDNIEKLVLTGSANSYGVGNVLANEITGNGGNNNLWGLAGNDTIKAGNGDDFAEGGAGDDQLDGGVGIDTAGFGSAATGVTVSLAIAGAQNTVGAGTDTLSAFENLSGSSFADKLTGNGSANKLQGWGGADILVGGAGNDQLVGGAGDDVLDGGEGIDTVQYAIAAAGVTVSLALSGSQNTLGDGLDKLIGIENLEGSAFADKLTGDAAANNLKGAAGDDVLNGGAGKDAVDGGEGSDVYVIAAAGDHPSAEIADTGASGTDEVRFSATGTAQTLVLRAGDTGIERIVIGTGTEAVAHTTGTLAHGVDARLLGNGVSVLGNSGSNKVHGTGFGDQLDGGAGSDRLLGYAGDDVLDGGKQLDQLLGGLGDDTYIVDDYGDATVELVGEGTDTVIASATVTLRDNVENLVQSGVFGINGTGNALDNVMEGNGATNRLFGLEGSDTLIGNEGNDQLNGGAGNDTLIGGAGNDYYFVDSAADTVTELAGEGRDTVRATASYTLSAEVEWLELQGSANLDGTGNGLANVLKGNDGDNGLSGLAGNDKLYGGAGSDRVDGGEGNDVLEGGSGRDEFTGGAGVDRFLFRDGDFGGATIVTADVIHDFVHAQGDKIRLDAVDANSTLAGNQAFAFLGTGAFTNTAGQLRYEQADGNTFVQGDIDGDGVADFVIQVDGTVNLVGGDFIL